MRYQWSTLCRPQRMLQGVAMTALAVFASAVQAQPDQATLDELQHSAEVFSVTLTESLGLNQRQGIFSPRNGHIDGRYLARQGMVFEIVMPNTVRTGVMGIDLEQLDQSLSALSEQLGTMVERGLVHRPDPEAIREAMALSLRSGDVAAFYREKLQQVSALSESINVERALAHANSTLQRLQSEGMLDSEVIRSTRQSLGELQQEAFSELQSLRELQQEIRQQGLNAIELPDDQQVAQWEAAFENMSSNLAGVESRAREQLSALREQQRQLREQNRQAQQQALATFESRLFETVCNYAAAMRSLPDQEYVTLILADSGETSGEPRDRVHVLTQASITQCRRGEMNGSQLAASADTYNY